MAAEVLGFNIWTKNMPQPYLAMYVEAAQERQAPLVAIVDDVLPAVLFDRSNQQTADYNEAYRTSMEGMGFQSVSFVSAMLPERSADLGRLYATSTQIGLPAFLALLPERKRMDGKALTLAEVVDTCWQIHVLEAGMSYAGITRYLTGKRSTALFRYTKKVIDNFEFDIIDS